MISPLHLPEQIIARALREVRGVDARIEALIEQLGLVVEVWRDVADSTREHLARLDLIEGRAESLDGVLVNLGPALDAVPRIEALAREALPTLQRAVELGRAAGARGRGGDG